MKSINIFIPEFIIISGYHHKAHKDEYAKEKKFYDSEDKKGDHKKYGNEHEFHESKKGEHKKGDFHKSDYDKAHKGKKGHHKKVISRRRQFQFACSSLNA